MTFLLFTIAILALSFNWLAIYLSEKLNLLDAPDSRKRHSGAIPLTGGIAIFLTVLFGTYAVGITPYTHKMLFIATAVFVIGVYDDRNNLSATWRLIIQYCSGIALATFGGIIIRDAGNLLALGDIRLLILAVPLTALSVAGLSNAYNMIDGIDGLAGINLTGALGALRPFRMPSGEDPNAEKFAQLRELQRSPDLADNICASEQVTQKVSSALCRLKNYGVFEY